MTDAVVWRAEHCIHVHVCTRATDCVDALTPCREALVSLISAWLRQSASMTDAEAPLACGNATLINEYD